MSLNSIHQKEVNIQEVRDRTGSALWEQSGNFVEVYKAMVVLSVAGHICDNGSHYAIALGLFVSILF